MYEFHSKYVNLRRTAFLVNFALDIDDCDPNPCMNGATCVDGIDDFTCECVAGFTDSMCSTGMLKRVYS